MLGKIKKGDSDKIKELKDALKDYRNQCEEQKKLIEETKDQLHKEKKKVEDAKDKLERARSCSICFDHEKKIMFLPCMHILTCEYCATLIDRCPSCRDPIDEKVLVNIG